MSLSPVHDVCGSAERRGAAQCGAEQRVSRTCDGAVRSAAIPRGAVSSG